MQEKLEILIQTDDAKLSALIQKWNQHNITVGEAKQLMSSLKKEGGDYIKVQGEQTEKAQQYIAAQQQVNAGMKQMQSEIRGATGAVGGLHQRYFELGTMIREVTVLMGKIGIAVMVANQIKDIVLSIAHFELLKGSMDQFLEGTGYKLNRFMQELRDKTNGEVADIELLQQALEFRMIGVSADKIAGYLDIIHLRSEILGKSFAEIADLFLKMELGGAARAARSLRLHLDENQAIKDYATSLGTIPEKLDAQAKKQAIIVGLIKEAKLENDKFEKVNKESIESVNKLEASIKNLKNNFTNLLPVVTFIANLFSFMLESTINIGKGFHAIFTRDWDKLKEVVGFFYSVKVPKWGGAEGSWETDGGTDKKSPAGSIKEMQDKVDALKQAWENAGNAIDRALAKKKFDEASAALDRMMGKEEKKEKEFYPWEKYGELRGEGSQAIQRTGPKIGAAGSWYDIFGRGIVAGAKGSMAGREESKSAEEDERQWQKELQKAKKSWQVFFMNPILDGLDTVGQSIQQNVHDKLVESFSGAKSIAQQFVVSVLDGLTQIAVKAAANAIFSLILNAVMPGSGGGWKIFGSLMGLDIGGGGGGGPLGDFIGGGGAHTSRRSTPGHTTIITQINNQAMQSRRNSGAGTQHIVVHVVGKFKGGDIALSNEIGQQVLNRQRDGR